MIQTKTFHKTTWVFLYVILLFIWGCGGASESSEDYRPDFLDNKGVSDLVCPAGLNLPKIVVETPYSGEILPSDQDSVIVTGRVEDGDNIVRKFLVDDVVVALESDGSFNTLVRLPDDGKMFACIEFAATDVEEYSSKKRIAVLRGEKTSARELAQDGIGIVLEESLFQAITDMINPVINDVLSQDDFIDMAVDVVAGIPLQIGLTEPVKTVLEMTINDIIMLEDRAVKVHNLEILDPEMDDSVRFLAEMSFKGFELDAAVGIFLFGNEAQTVNVKMRLNEEVRALLDIRLDTIDSNKIGIKLVNLDIDINDIEITLPDMPVFNKNPIKIKNGLAMLLNLAFSRLLDDLIGFSILLPDSPMNLGMMNDLLDGMSISLSKDSDPLDISSIIDADFSAMNIGFGINFFGDANHMGLGLDITAFASDQPDVISLPPSISLAEALESSEGVEANIALALSSDSINRTMGVLAGINSTLTLPGNELLQALTDDMKLPEKSTLKINLNAPPVLDFRGSQGIISVPNLVVEIYMNSLDDDGLQAAFALDLVAQISAGVVFRAEDFYLNFDFSLPTLEVFYLADRMGISQLLDMEELLDILMPQVVDMLKVLLSMPLRMGTAELTALLPKFPITIPEYTVTLSELRMDGGYLSIFVNME